MPRVKGDGSVYQRKDGRWVASILFNGKRISRYASTKSEATQKLRDLRNQESAGRLAATNSLTVADYLSDWLTTSEARLRPSTLHSYRTIARCHIDPEIGRLRLQHLSPRNLALLYAKKRRAGLSARRVEMIHRLLHKALGDAVRWRLLGANPADDVEPPKPAKRPVALWSQDQTRRFLQRCMEVHGQYDVLFAFLLVSGVRVGEALGLTWGDVDSRRQMITVRRQVTWVNNQPSLGSPKTEAGFRSVSVGALGMAILERLNRAGGGVAEQCTSAGQGVLSYIFVSKAGTVPSPSNLRRSLRQLCVSAGLPTIRIHDLRHLNASLLVANGADLKAVQRRLGHSSLSLTLHVYAHAFTDLDQEAAESIGRALTKNTT